MAISVSISNIKDPSMFLLKPADLDALEKEIFSYGQYDRSQPVFQQGLEVLVKSVANNMWLRGMFQGRDIEKEEYQITLTDSTTTILHVPFDNVRNMPLQFSLKTIQPKKASVCYLEGSSGQRWDDIKTTQFKELVNTKQLKAEFLSPGHNNTPREVRLFINNDQDVSLLLNSTPSALASGPHRVLAIVSPIEIYVLPESQLQTLKRINYALDLTSVMKFTQISPDMVEEIKVSSSMIAVYCSESDAWYRGHITQILDDRVQVFCIDYGHRKIVKIDKMALRLCPHHLTIHPPVCQVCAYDCPHQKRPDQWTDIDLDALKTATSDRFHLEMTRIGDSISVGRPYAKFYSNQDLATELFKFPDASYPLRHVYADEDECYITYVDALESGATYIYIQLGCDAALSEFCDGCLSKYDIRKTPRMHKANPNDLCVVYYEDAWYRARVIRAEENKQFRVALVDNGEEIKTSELYTIHSSLVEIYSFAIKCRAGSENHSLTTEECQELARLSETNTPLRVRFLSKCEPVEVRLFHGENQLFRTLHDNKLPTLYSYKSRNNWPPVEKDSVYIGNLVYRPLPSSVQDPPICSILYVHLENDKDNLNEVHNLLVPMQTPEPVPSGVDIKRGNACLVDFRHFGGHLERVAIEEEENFGRVYVRLIDKGERKNVSRESLLMIPPAASQLLKIPPLAIALEFLSLKAYPPDLMNYSFVPGTPIVFKPVDRSVTPSNIPLGAIASQGLAGQVSPRMSEKFGQTVYAQCVSQNAARVALQMVYQQNSSNEVHNVLNKNSSSLVKLCFSCPKLINGLDCVAASENTFRRARIMGLVDSGKVKLKWLDFAGEVTMYVDHLYTMPSALYEIPPLILTCRLFSIHPVQLGGIPMRYKIIGGDRSSWLIECCS